MKKSISATEFKAKCLAILDEVASKGTDIVILKRGRPVARLTPVPSEEVRYPQETLFGTVETLGDIIEPVLPADAWDASKGKM